VTWPVVALVTIGIGGVLGVLYLADSQDRSAMIAVLVTLSSVVTTAVAGRRTEQVRQQLEAVHKHVGTNQKALIAKLPDPPRRVVDNPGGHRYPPPPPF
jgi:hypothetical protein